MLFPYIKSKGVQMNKLSFSVYCAAALIYMMRRQRDASGLSLFSDKIDFHADARLSSVHLDLLYNNLGNLLKTENIGLKRNTNAVDAINR
jgi:hypothetical protein